MIAIPIEIVRAATAIPIKASFVAERLGVEINIDSPIATKVDDIMQPISEKKLLIMNNPPKPAAINIAAPPPIPKRFGSPNELRVDNCINIPASPKQFPTMILTNILGILISQTIVWEISWFCLNKPANISLIERSEGPIKTPMIMNPKTSNPKIEY